MKPTTTLNCSGCSGHPEDAIEGDDDEEDTDRAYEVIDLRTDESHGTFETLEEARGCVRFDKLRAYAIWRYNVRVECCDPYEGDDDRVKQALGEPNASEQDQ